MPTLRLHLEDEELAPVRRLADQLDLRPEDLVYAALNRMMLESDQQAVRTDIQFTHSWRPGTLPVWSDASRSVHAYEGKTDVHADLP